MSEPHTRNVNISEPDTRIVNVSVPHSGNSSGSEHHTQNVTLYQKSLDTEINCKLLRVHICILTNNCFLTQEGGGKCTHSPTLNYIQRFLIFRESDFHSALCSTSIANVTEN